MNRRNVLQALATLPFLSRASVAKASPPETSGLRVVHNVAPAHPGFIHTTIHMPIRPADLQAFNRAFPVSEAGVANGHDAFGLFPELDLVLQNCALDDGQRPKFPKVIRYNSCALVLLTTKSGSEWGREKGVNYRKDPYDSFYFAERSYVTGAPAKFPLAQIILHREGLRRAGLCRDHALWKVAMPPHGNWSENDATQYIQTMERSLKATDHIRSDLDRSQIDHATVSFYHKVPA